MRFKLLSCEVFYREMCRVVSESPHTVDLEFLPKAMHDLGADGMRTRVQSALAAVPEQRYDAILLGYGLCNNGLVGLTARSIPLVAPRAHDCITCFLGSRERYLEYFNSHPGAYFQTIGWIERAENHSDLSQFAVQRQTGLNAQFEDLVERYGEDNARYLVAVLGDGRQHYSQFTYIRTGVEPDGSFEQQTRDEAAKRGWQFEKVAGDLLLLRRLVGGVWDEADFLVVPPGYRIAASFDEHILTAEQAA